MSTQADVIIPDGMKPKPEAHEVEIAWVLARHYSCLIEFIVPSVGYKRKSADINMQSFEWEIKSPLGNTRLTIENRFKDGLKQSRHVIVDSVRTKMDDRLVLARVKQSINKHKSVRKVIVITKKREVIELFR